MTSNLSIHSIDSDVFYVEQSSNYQSLPRPNTKIVLNSAEMSINIIQEMTSISSFASTEPQIVTMDSMDSDSSEPTMPYGFGRQLPITQPSLNDLKRRPIQSIPWQQWS